MTAAMEECRISWRNGRLAKCPSWSKLGGKFLHNAGYTDLVNRLLHAEGGGLGEATSVATVKKTYDTNLWTPSVEDHNDWHGMHAAIEFMHWLIV